MVPSARVCLLRRRGGWGSDGEAGGSDGEAGGKKLPELDALDMAHNAIENGAAGVDMGRNIFQSDNPVAMIRAIRAVVHESAKPSSAYEEFVRPVLHGH